MTAAGGGVPGVKICGLGRRADVEAAAEAGASHVGLVLAKSPRRVEPEAASGLAAAARGLGLAPVGVFVDAPEEEVARLADGIGLAVVQLHGAETPDACARLRDRGLEVWKAVRPRSRGELASAVARYRGAADAMLVEGRSEERAGGTGTGFPHRWLEPGDGAPRPGRLVLAGGLEPGNVAEAVRRVRPEMVDVSTGVERAPGLKDPDRIRAFVEAVAGAVRERRTEAPGSRNGGHG